MRNCRRRGRCGPAPLYDRFKAMGAFFGVGYGLEQALWFAPKGKKPRERSPSAAPTPSRSSARNAARCAMVSASSRSPAMPNMRSRARVPRPGFRMLLANRMPAKGQLALTPMLNRAGKLIGDFTVAKAARRAVLHLRIGRGRELSYALVRSASAEAMAVFACGR